ncbi:MAG: TlpA family protein disulfide reductase [Thermoleophilia bacterium]|nr:TlpA family protein disulfide reductase [Thermoleophilia bacterium]
MGKAQRLKAERAAEAARAASIAAARGRGTNGGRTLPVFWIVFGAIIVIAIAVLVIASGSGTNDKSPSISQRAFSTVNKSGASLPAYTGKGTDSAVGRIAPVISGTDVDKRPISIGGPSDRPTMVLFVAHWCPHCQAEIPRLTKYLKQHGGLPADVRLVTVATASSKTKPNFPPGAWLAREKWPAEVLLDDEVATGLDAYGTGAFPYFVELDKSGKVVKRQSGEITMGDFAADLKALVAAK